jgi:hypothetical protein
LRPDIQVTRVAAPVNDALVARTVAERFAAVTARATA